MRKRLVIGGVLTVLLALVAWVVFRHFVPATPPEPQTAEAQFAQAEKSDLELQAQAPLKSAQELQPKIDQTIELYTRVWTKFGPAPQNTKAPEALQRVAQIHEKVEKNLDKALADLDKLAKENPGEQYEGASLLKQAELIEQQAVGLKSQQKPEAAARYQDAIAKLDEFRRKFEKSDQAGEALMESGRIWQDGIGDPPIYALKIFEQVLKDYPRSKSEPEALYRLAKQYEKIREFEKALQLYAQLLELYPKADKWAAQALEAQGHLLADEEKQHDEAAKAFDKLAQDFPNTTQGQSAGGAARQERAAAAQDDGQKYGQSRYGGSVPIYPSDDKPVPPAQMLKQFAEQKLDAQSYDLNVTLAPADHRITVQGTLKLVNHGAQRSKLLFMLGRGLNVSDMTVNGSAAKTVHGGETLEVTLPAPLATDAPATLAFNYTGQYADADAIKNLLAGRPPVAPIGSKTDQLKGQPAPPITLKTPDGKDLSLADQKNKVTLVAFWATWRNVARDSLPHLQKLADDSARTNRGLTLLAVNSKEQPADIQKFLTDNKYTFTVLCDQAGDLLKPYAVTTLPTFFIIGRDGLIKDVITDYTASTTDQALDAALDKALAEASTAAATTTTPASAPATATAPGPGIVADPQMALGTYGYALAGASWYPITIIGDVFDAHVTLTTPADMEAVSNGALVTRQRAVGTGTGHFEFQTKNPVFGLYFAYGPYVVQDQQVGDIHFYTYLREQNKSKHDAYVQVANRILSFYAGKFAPFPYEKMAIIDAPLPPFLGGVGPASLMYLQNVMVDHPEVPETLLAHELAHQWFGNLLPISITDPGYNQWLSEGFATYCDALYTEHKDGPEAFKDHILKYQQLYLQLALRSTPTPIRDTLGPNQAMYRPIVYEKGALVLHMLRRVMGDDQFFQLMRQFVANYRNQPTTTEGFQKLAEQIYGKDLTWFFDQWYNKTVYAHWKVTAAVTTNPNGASTVVTITQPDAPIKMPADVTLLGDKGQREIIKDVMIEGPTLTLPARQTPFIPGKVIVDEDNWVLKRPGPDNIWTSTPPP